MEYKYNGAGAITNTIDALGNTQARFYNTAGELTNSVDALSNVTEYRYDSSGRRYMTVFGRYLGVSA